MPCMETSECVMFLLLYTYTVLHMLKLLVGCVCPQQLYSCLYPASLLYPDLLPQQTNTVCLDLKIIRDLTASSENDLRAYAHPPVTSPD